MNANERERDRDKAQGEIKKKEMRNKMKLCKRLMVGHTYLQTRFPRELPEKGSKYGAWDLGEVKVQRVRGPTVSPHGDLTLY